MTSPPQRNHPLSTFRGNFTPDFQIIVSDHADLPHAWYQESVRYNWRGGEKLIPTTWLDTNPTP